MAFGSTSSVFTQWMWNPMLNTIRAGETGPTGFTDLDTDVLKVALFNNTVTPDKDAVVGSTGYNTGTWTTGNEVTDATNWVAGGRTLAPTGDGVTTGTGFVMFDAADLAGGGTLTLAATYGCLVYDDSITAGTVADQGICFNSFGGAQSVTAGTFTIVWHANGIFRITN
jgi:hypothetical protein